jgi:hypothetical protein
MKLPDIGFRHFTALQWIGTFFIVTVPLLAWRIVTLSAPIGIADWVELISHGLLAGWCLLFINWPTKAGFRNYNGKDDPFF